VPLDCLSLCGGGGGGGDAGLEGVMSIFMVRTTRTLGAIYGNLSVNRLGVVMVGREEGPTL